jgi:hypothetical protein
MLAITHTMENKMNKGSQMGHTKKKIFLKVNLVFNKVFFNLWHFEDNVGHVIKDKFKYSKLIQYKFFSNEWLLIIFSSGNEISYNMFL